MILSFSHLSYVTELEDWQNKFDKNKEWSALSTCGAGIKNEEQKSS